MNVPKILYHGTSGIRYALMLRKDRKMRSDIEHYFKRDDKATMGYLFLTDNPYEALHTNNQVF